MIQGTMSNAGKSLLAAGLCRIMKQDGYKVAPFKSQNMALNSFITKEELEMGRAQVMQAEAAGIEPSVRMNPILLKPTNDTGSQVIVNGEVLGNMSARDYFAYKKQLVPEVMKAYESLAAEYDIIVIEGAGSPAEINLKQDDSVNMGMAKRAKAPVLLVGDIDRGGVFAQLVGTVMLLEEDEQKLVKGLIVNKFRGDKTILEPGLAMLEEKCRIPVVGVAPYMNIDVEDEHSLTERFHQQTEAALIDIAVIRLPRISNFTDFNVFESFEGVSLRYVERVSRLGAPDMIILPGTKNTMKDLLWLRQSGLEAAVKKAREKGAVIFGICGGYQMLGETLSDPAGVEEGGNMRGMGLLPMDTVFAENKTRTRVQGSFGSLGGVLKKLSHTELTGYEIHMGVTTLKEEVKTLTEIYDQCVANGAADDPAAHSSERTALHDQRVDNRAAGDSVSTAQRKQEGAQAGNVYGSYVHGIFDREDVAKNIIAALAEAKGIALENLKAVDYQAYKESQYDILADTLREHLDMKKIYQILEEGTCQQ